MFRKPDTAYRENRTKKSKMDEDKCKVIRMLIVVVVLFTVCWGPILINNLLVATGVLPVLHLGFLKPMRQVFFLMSYMNSCTNPVVYGFMSKHFRESFKRAICCCFQTRQNKRDLYNYSRATRTSIVNGGRVQVDGVNVGRTRNTPTLGYRGLQSHVTRAVDSPMRTTTMRN